MQAYQFWLIVTQVVLALILMIHQSYLAQKGKNKADKEDIEELTKIVEGVKSDFLREHAKITSNLDVLKDRRGKTYTQAQQAIINFYSAYNEWLEMVSGVNPEHHN